MRKSKIFILPYFLPAKIAVVIAIVLFMTVGISAYIGIHIQEDRLITRTKRSSLQLSQMIYNHLVRSMISGRKEEVQSFLSDLGRAESISDAIIFDSNGLIIYSARISEQRHKIYADYSYIFKSNIAEPIIETRGRTKYLAVLTPIRNNKSCQRCHGIEKNILGVLYLQPSLDWVVQESATNRNLIICSAIITVLVSGIVISLLMYRLVLQPVSALTQTMATVATGDLSKRVEIRTEDELGQLAQHFNRMIAQLETANKQLAVAHEAELLRASKLASLGELAAGLAHELKNPLSGISAATQVLYDQVPVSDAHREVFLEMMNQVNRLNKTLNDLLSFAQPKPLQVIPVDVNEMVRNVILLIRAQAAQQQMQLREEYASGLPQISLDAEQIKQVLLNLILNAFQAMAPGGVLTIGTKKSEANTVSITVQDTGKGIPAENLNKIFVPFFTTRAKGTGLGLSVCKKIIEMHMGRLEVVSQVNQGTTFTIYLPTR
jgi:signal transduction histidine kinase